MLEVLEGQPGEEPLTDYSAGPAGRRIRAPAPVAAPRRRHPLLALGAAVLAVVATAVVLRPSPAAAPATGATPPPPAPVIVSSPPTTIDPFATWSPGALPDSYEGLVPASCVPFLAYARD